MWKDCTDLQIKRGTSFHRNWCFKECGLRWAESMIDLRDIEKFSWKKNVNLSLSLSCKHLLCQLNEHSLIFSAQSVPNYSLALIPCELTVDIWTSTFNFFWCIIWLSYTLKLGYFNTKSARFNRTVSTSPHLLNLIKFHEQYRTNSRSAWH